MPFFYTASGHLTSPYVIGESSISHASVDNSTVTCDINLPCYHYFTYDLGDTYNLTKVSVLIANGSQTSLKIFADKTNSTNLCYDGTDSTLNPGVYNELDCVKENKHFLTVQVVSDCSANTASLCDLEVYRKSLLFALFR